MPCMSNTTKWPLILWGYLGPILTIWDPNKKFLVGPLYGPVGVQQKVLSIPYSSLSVIGLKSKSENKEIRHKSLEMHSTLCRCRVNNALHCLDSTMQSQHCIAKPKKMISPPTTASFAASQLLSWDICKPGEISLFARVDHCGYFWLAVSGRRRTDLLRYFGKKQQISLFRKVDWGIFWDGLIRQDGLAKRLIINGNPLGTTWRERGKWVLKCCKTMIRVLLEI